MTGRRHVKSIAGLEAARFNGALFFSRKMSTFGRCGRRFWHAVGEILRVWHTAGDFCRFWFAAGKLVKFLARCRRLFCRFGPIAGEIVTFEAAFVVSFFFAFC